LAKQTQGVNAGAGGPNVFYLFAKKVVAELSATQLDDSGFMARYNLIGKENVEDN
jgi:hypothetical protein